MSRKKPAPYKNGDIVSYLNRDGEKRVGTVESRHKATSGKVIYSIRIARGVCVFRYGEDILGKLDKNEYYRRRKEREREYPHENHRRRF